MPCLGKKPDTLQPTSAVGKRKKRKKKTCTSVSNEARNKEKKETVKPGSAFFPKMEKKNTCCWYDGKKTHLVMLLRNCKAESVSKQEINNLRKPDEINNYMFLHLALYKR